MNEMKKAVPAAVAVPDGWRLVPERLTPEMLVELTNGDSSKNKIMKLRYEQMLAATPTEAAPVVLPEPDAAIREVLALVNQAVRIGQEAARHDFHIRPTDSVNSLKRLDSAILTIETKMRALLAGVSAPAALAVERGEVLVTVSGFTGSGKSAIAGEIEIMCRALGLQVEWPDSDSEKHMTHADWIAALEQYKPRVRIVECNVPHSVVKGQDK